MKAPDFLEQIRELADALYNEQGTRDRDVDVVLETPEGVEYGVHALQVLTNDAGEAYIAIRAS